MTNRDILQSLALDAVKDREVKKFHNKTYTK